MSGRLPAGDVSLDHDCPHPSDQTGHLKPFTDDLPVKLQKIFF